MAEKQKLEEKKSYKIFRDVSMISVGTILIMYGIVPALVSYIIIAGGVLVVKKYKVK